MIGVGAVGDEGKLAASEGQTSVARLARARWCGEEDMEGSSSESAQRARRDERGRLELTSRTSDHW